MITVNSSIRTPKDASKQYIKKLFEDVAEYAETLPQYKEAVYIHIGREDTRGGFNISFYNKEHCGLTRFYTANTSKELIAFCEGIRTVKRGF